MNTKFSFFPYQAMNYKAAQTWLDRKAEQGWELKHIYLGCIAHFQRKESPRHFVDLDIQNTYGNTDADYLQLCSDAGWELVQDLRGMLLFRSLPGRSPAPLQTDGELEWERFWDKYRPRIWSTLLTLAAIGLVLFLLTLPTRSSMTVHLASNSSLLYLLYLALGIVYSTMEWVHSKWYLARCRRSGRVEDPGSISTFLDTLARLQAPLLWLCLLASVLELFGPGFGKTVDLEWYPMNGEYTATVEACREWPVVLASDLDLPDSQDSRHLEGFRSVLVDFLQYRELTDGEGSTFHILTTERYHCLNESLAKWVIRQRREETRNGAFLWGKLDWEPVSGLGFDESYTCYEGAYLLIRQGRVVALVGSTATDLTTAQNLASIRERVLR